MNTSVAGFNTGLASKGQRGAAGYRLAAHAGGNRRGAAGAHHARQRDQRPQHSAGKRQWPSVRASQSRGISTCTSEPSSTPSSAAFHTAVK